MDTRGKSMGGLVTPQRSYSQIEDDNRNQLEHVMDTVQEFYAKSGGPTSMPTRQKVWGSTHRHFPASARELTSARSSLQVLHRIFNVAVDASTGLMSMS